ncbi:MAG: penicillin-binding protein 2 [Clostridia bacterium]|nr:penicillin-binding protein 2 [Clostridia bacterium]
MDKKDLNKRFIFIYTLLAIFTVLCIIRLFNLQIVNGDEYKEQAENRLVRACTIKAPRGEIMDRYGVPLVTNNMGYYILIQSIDKKNSTLNETISSLVDICKADGVEYFDDFPISKPPYKFTFSGNTARDDLEEWKDENDLKKFESPEEIMNYYFEEYDISEHFNAEKARDIVAVRYTMETKNFSVMNPYTFANDISMNTVQKIKECSFNLKGVSVEIEPVREYPYGSMAAHILGRTDIIYREEYLELRDQGYGMNDIIGKDGLEKVLEKHLKGKDGYKRVEQTRSGSISQTLNVKEAETSNYAVLTLDAGLQKVAEEALAENITATRAEKGFDCYSGAAVAVEISTGDVLAMASLPGYAPTEYTKSYNKLLNDPHKPLFNRALDGAYTPGSTFKPLVAIAALEEGIISPTEIIEDKGVYTYYAPSYQPTCLIWKNTGETHGPINVSEAIGVSCNYFFFDVGRRLTIDTLEKYAHLFGLGEKTGIELSESNGIVAGPEYRDKLDMEWYPGDTLQAAIGQSDNMFTPAQLASYVSTVLNKGNRYALRLVKEVRSYKTGEIVYKNDPKVISQIEISDSTVAAVKDGMRRVTEDGTAKVVFDDFPVAVGGKTGTAEVGSGSDTVLFVGFAPYENPQIAVAIVLEHGATSSYAARVARSMFEYYLGLSDVIDEIYPVNQLLK